MQAMFEVAGGMLLGALLAALILRRRATAPPEPGPEELKTAAEEVEATLRKFGHWERAAVDRLLKRGAYRDPNTAFEERMTFGQRLADRVARFGGSWTFIGLFLLVMAVWMVLNSRSSRPFDPFPYILLNLVLSCLAALQAPVIMMSQNRQSMKDRLMASHDYEVNLRSELEIQTLHTRFDELREHDWAELVTMQQRQLQLLDSIVRDLGGRAPGAR